MKAEMEKTLQWLVPIATNATNVAPPSCYPRASNCGIRSPVKSPNQKTIQPSTQKQSPSAMLTVEDQDMLRDVSKREKKNTWNKQEPGI
ncbi:hypothetical protein V6N12_055615 [Hibiscus sabdariffa]|uniref:DUF668 domain-containing protein n=1 Tax=Hibiscus sabdariffa TaxID=183260 RepID=A0ABR2BU63_9ROSI